MYEFIDTLGDDWSLDDDYLGLVGASHLYNPDCDCHLCNPDPDEL